MAFFTIFISLICSFLYISATVVVVFYIDMVVDLSVRSVWKKWCKNSTKIICYIKYFFCRNVGYALKAVCSINAVDFFGAIFLSFILYLTISAMHSQESVLVLCMLYVVVGIFPVFVFLVTIFRFKWVKKCIKNPFFKYMFYVVLISFTWLAKAEISNELNAEFGVGAGNMPLALSAGVFLRLLAYFSLPVAVVALVLEIFFIVVLLAKMSKRFFVSDVMPLIVVFTLLIGLVFSQKALVKVGSSDFSRFIIYRIAYEYDFNERYFCDGTYGGNSRVLFLGSDERVGLRADAINVDTPLWKMKDKELRAYYPRIIYPEGPPTLIMCNIHLQTINNLK